MPPRVVPCTGRAAMRWIAETHRHLPKLQGALFAVAAEDSGRVVAVGTVGNPARKWQGTGRCVISRVASLPSAPCANGHARPYCTMIYAALGRAAQALGYVEIWTYTLADETGVSLLAAGFLFMGWSYGANGHHSRPGRSTVNAGRKGRWARGLTPDTRAALADQSAKICEGLGLDVPPSLLPRDLSLADYLATLRGSPSDAQ